MSAAPTTVAASLPSIQPSSFGLTPHQERVMHLFARCLRQKEIAAELGVSKRTVEIHWLRIQERLGIKGLVRFGIWYAHHFPERVAMLDAPLNAGEG